MSNTIFLRDKGGPHIKEIVDIEELTHLFQSYSDITGMSTALLDLEGEILIATNWQDSCTQFHRKNEITKHRCLESDTALAGALAKGDHYNIYRCKNGLVDVAMPVFVEGEYIANFFTGQFFLEQPNLEHFSQQADDVGFEKATYLNAIKNVPVYDEATIKSHMSLLVHMAEMVGKSGAANLRAMEANKALEKHKNQLQSLVEKRTQKLEESLISANAANLAKSKFLSNMSHELRTPLNAVLGFSEILRAKETDPTKKQYLESINLAGKGLLNLINSILDLSKIETGKMPIQNDPMSIKSLIQEMDVIFNTQAEEKDLDFTLIVSHDVPNVIDFDEVKLRQILVNLIGNAIKFTSKGFIEVLVESPVVNQEEGFSSVSIAIKDSGKGIGAEEKVRIFEAFEQSMSQKISEYGGTGLGLALTKEFVNILGGEITVDSAIGKGSVFRCNFSHIKVLPDDTLDDKISEASPYSISFAPATILVVDDHAMNRDLMATHLNQWGFQVLLAENGKQAIELTKLHKPDLVFMDIKMPVMDGYEATLRLKADGATRHIPIVAATASALSDAKKRIRKVTDDYLSKPITRRDLERCLIRFIPQVHDESNNDKSDLMKVMVVDDVSMNRLLLLDILQEWKNLEIIAASSGEEAVQLSCGSERPNLILMDCEMPGMNGFEATQKIRDWEKDNQVTSSMIILTTSYTPDEFKSKQNAEMFDGLLSKPFSFEDVAKLINNHL